jgi:hypothetical protein
MRRTTPTALRRRCPDQGGGRPGPGNEIGSRPRSARDEEAEGDERRPDREPTDREHGGGAGHDPRAEHGREQVEERSADDEGDEAEQVEPGMDRLEERPVLQDRSQPPTKSVASARRPTSARATA